MTELEKALSANRRKGNGDRLRLGVTLKGENAKVVRQALEKAGISNVSGYVRELVLADLKRRLGQKAG